MKPSAFSTHSSPQNLKAPVWDCPSAGGSSSRMAAACGRAPTQDGVPSFNSRCPASDGRLAASSQRAGDRKPSRITPPIASGSSRTDAQFCNLMTAEPQRRLTAIDTGSALLGDKAAVDDELGTG